MQNYNTDRPGTRQPVASLQGNRATLILLAFFSLSFAVYTAYINGVLRFPKIDIRSTSVPANLPVANAGSSGILETDSVATVVDKALYFRTLLTSTQLATVEKTYTTTLARKWSNLPCGSGCRNGIQFSALTGAQLSAALDVIKAATGTVANDGFDEFQQIRYADKYLGLNGGGNGYDSTIYFIAFLNTPSTTGTWMLQFGGHHYASNIAFNGSKVVGTTPHFMGVEPTSFTLNNVSYAPLKEERSAFKMMLAGLTTAQLETSKLSSTFSDCLLSPGESNGNTNTFPATKQGLIASGLTTAQKNLIFAAIKNYTEDEDDSSAAILQAQYESDINSTYIAWTGSGTSGDTSTFLNTNTNYVRLDGPNVWIEFICQTGVVFRTQIHYHTVFRDHTHDYGSDLTNTTLPLSLLSFDAVIQGKGRLLSWKTAGDKSVNYFDIERSANPATGFTTIGKLAAANSGANSYTFYDNEDLNTTQYYYRIKMAQPDGSFTYSNIAVVKYINNQVGISLYPNPATNLLTVSLPQNTENATVKILTASGKTVVTTTRSGRNLDVDISGLPHGTYYLQLLHDKSVYTAKFIK